MKETNQENICHCGHEKERHREYIGCEVTSGDFVMVCACDSFRPQKEKNKCECVEIGTKGKIPKYCAKHLKERIAAEREEKELAPSLKSPESIEGWEDRFEELNSRDMFVTGDADYDDIKDFIRQLLHDTEQSAREEGRKDRGAPTYLFGIFDASIAEHYIFLRGGPPPSTQNVRERCLPS